MKNEKWGEKAYYIEYKKEPGIGGKITHEIKSATITKHGRIYNTCNYGNYYGGRKFYRETGREVCTCGNPTLFFPTYEYAERYLNRTRLKEDLQNWFGGWSRQQQLDKLTDEELQTVHDILKGAEERL